MKKRISKLLIWVLLFPFLFPVVANAGTQINLNTQSFGTAPARLSTLSVTVSGNAVTISAPNPASSVNGTRQYLDFRSTDLTSGATSSVLAAPSNLVIPSGATLGCLNAASAATCRLIVLETLPTSGVPELAVVNAAGGNNLDETTLLTTTTISSGATSASGVYATTGRSSLPFRVIGTFVAAETTAGTWATAPSLVQGAGGQAIAAMQSLGYGQTWQNVTGSRVLGTTYYNTTGRPISLSIQLNWGTGTTTGSIYVIYENGQFVQQIEADDYYESDPSFSVVVPPGSSYSCTFISGTTSTISYWFELR